MRHRWTEEEKLIVRRDYKGNRESLISGSALGRYSLRRQGTDSENGLGFELNGRRVDVMVLVDILGG